MRRPDTSGAPATGKYEKVSGTPLTTAITLLVFLLIVPPPGLFADEMSAAEARGKHIYTEGESLSRRVITAQLQRTEAPAPAGIVPCISCHGADGRGSDDVIGVAPLNISWRALTAPERHVHGQRSHAPFDAATLARSITAGIDADDNSLDATMPRYIMADEDMTDLIAYLKHIDSELDPGLSDAQIRVGTVLPTDGPLGATGSAMKAVIEAYFSEINATGGVHGRKLELVVGAYGADNTPAFWHAQDLLSTEPLFALIASFLPGYEAELSTLISERQIPLIGPHTLVSADSVGRYEFHVQASLAQQVEVLVESLVAQPGRSRLAVVHPVVKSFDTLADAVSRRAERHGLDPVVEIPYTVEAFDAASVAGSLRGAKVDAVVFLGSAAELLELSEAADELQWHPTLLAPGSLAERAVFELPQSFDGRVFLSYASLPTDHTRTGIENFEGLHRRYQLDYRNSVAQIAAFSAARVLVEGLRRAGRVLSREDLIDSLESLREFQPGLVAPVSFGPSRHIGSLGAHVVRVDLAAGKLDAGRQWISLDSAEDAATR